MSIKPYPSCHFAYGPIDCVTSLKNDGFKADEIKSIHCSVDEMLIAFICNLLEVKYAPKSVYEAKFSMSFLMALGLFDGKITLDFYVNLKREKVLDFTKEVTYEKRNLQGFPKYFPGHLEATLQDGKKIQKDVFTNKGNFDNPPSLEELRAKFMNNALVCIDETKTYEIWKQIARLESLNEFSF